MFKTIFSKLTGKKNSPEDVHISPTSKNCCPVCLKNVIFQPIDNDYLALLDRYDYNYSLFHDETFNMLQYSCPFCSASDRDRLYAMYFHKKLGNTTQPLKLIDFAPSVSFFFRQFPSINYRSADLYLDYVDDKVDITDMQIYADNSIDIFICSHVLEHIEDDRKAMAELFRILKPGGWGIAMVPILRHSDHIIEGLPIDSEADRWRYYGQGDHVRYYNREGFVARLSEAGFKVNLLGIDYFGAAEFERCGIHPRSVLYIVEKL